MATMLAAAMATTAAAGMGMVAGATEAAAATAPGSGKGDRRRAASGPDRLTVGLLALAGFLAVLALLASQLQASVSTVKPHPVVVLRRVYRTTVVETIAGGSTANPAGGASVTQSVSSSGAATATAATAAAPTTRSS